MNQIVFHSQNYQGVSVFACKEEHAKEALLELSNGRKEVFTQGNVYRHFSLSPDTQYHLSVKGGDFVLVYLDQGEEMEKSGVLPLYGDGNALPERNRCHFSPMRGWMNDPNGLCAFQGSMHLFYQYNPYAQVWGNMHWGHAVSSDLVHWTHEPVALFPQPELQDKEELRGGAFSGSAIAYPDRMDLFFTRNVGDKAKSWRKEYQAKVSSSDGISFTGEHVILTCAIEGCSGDFRDPKVYPWHGGFLMVVGSAIHQKPAVLLFSSEDSEHWNFVSILYMEEDEKYAVAECPDFFELDGSWVVVVGLINRDKSPMRDVKYCIGTFDGTHFSKTHEGVLDEGRDFYATQTMVWEGRRILFGWNSDTHAIYRPTQFGANGTLSFPRDLSVEQGKLLQRPSNEVFKLVGEAPAEHVPYYLSLSAEQIGDFRIPLSGTTVLSWRDGKISLWLGDEERCGVRLDSLRSLEVFVDTALIEMFINDGEKVVSIRYQADGKAPSSSDLDLPGVKVVCRAMVPVWR